MRVVLTDLGTKRWEGVNITNVQRVIDDLNSMDILGEILNEGEGNFIVDLKNVTHRITNVKIEGNQIKGDLTFIQNEIGKQAEQLFEMGLLKLSIRSAGIPPSDIHKIFTWDLVAEDDFKKRKRLVKIDQILEILNDYEDTSNI